MSQNPYAAPLTNPIPEPPKRTSPAPYLVRGVGCLGMLTAITGKGNKSYTHCTNQ